MSNHSLNAIFTVKEFNHKILNNMIKKVLIAALVIFSYSVTVTTSDRGNGIVSNSSVLAPKSIFLQSGNINTLFRTDGYFNYDKVTFSGGTAGMIWPTGTTQRLTSIYTTGIFIGAKSVISGNQKELRLAASFYGTHYSPGNIPVNGQVPPISVCNDSAFNGYLVSVTDQSLVNGGVRTKTAGGRTYTFNYSSWSAWPVNLGAPYVEVNGVPGYQPGWNADRPGTGNGNSRPTEMIFTVFMDYSNCTNNVHTAELSLPGGTLPLGVEVQQLAYAFDVDGFRDSYFVRYKIINKSGKNWDSTYIGLISDAIVAKKFQKFVDRNHCHSNFFSNCICCYVAFGVYAQFNDIARNVFNNRNFGG